MSAQMMCQEQVERTLKPRLGARTTFSITAEYVLSLMRQTVTGTIKEQLSPLGRVHKGRQSYLMNVFAFHLFKFTF